ncbi:MAG TPA: galactonate dehydratase, partial [Sulfitobacter sp.]|nr:galactonate dehydratase [Sulfitobacter sp.]
MLLSPTDNVVVATSAVPQGAVLPQDGLRANHDTPQGHKIAIRPIQQGAPILKFDTVIGYAAEDIAAGDWLHSHNIKFDAVDKDYAFARDYAPTKLLPPQERAQFMGIRRANGRVGTRNYIGLFVTVNCSATVARKVANHFDEERMEAWENVDGVIPFIHESGCGMELTGEPMDLLRRTLSGYIR